MRTTIDIDEGLIRKVMKISGARTKKAAIVTAMKEYLKTRKRKELKGMIGNYDEFDLSLKDLEKMRNES